MARVTRSRKFAIAEDETALASQTPLPTTQAKDREALAEANNLMTTNTFTTMDDAMQAEVKGLKAAYKSALGVGKKFKKSKSKRKDKQTDSQETIVDEGTPATYAPATTIPVEPRSTKGSIASSCEGTTEESSMPAQPPVRTTRRQLATAQAAKENSKVSSEIVDNGTPDMHLESPRKSSTKGERKEISRSSAPVGSPVKTLEEVERVYGSAEATAPADDSGEDSFVQQITCRSPAKPVSRIEDSVEALDQLEEALEALNQATLAERMVSPEKSKPKHQRPRSSLEVSHGNGKQTTVQPLAKQNSVRGQSKSGNATMRVKSAPKQVPALKRAASMNFRPESSSAKAREEPAKAMTNTKAPVKRPISLLPPKETVRSSKPPTRPTFELPGEAVALKLKEKREARLAQLQSSEDSSQTARNVSGLKVKSTKPPTKPTFELPGEEVSRRKRAAHEARLKAQEEEERKRREFKAKPIRNSVAQSMVPRETVASRARQSKAGVEDIEDGSLSISKRGSNVGAHRPSIAQLALANSSAPRSKGTFIPPVRKPSPNIAATSTTGRPLQRAISVTDSDLRKRAKEIYQRDARLTEEMEREKRDREAAAKRAREEAAERGRQASREWAERQLAKKMAEGDKGLHGGYGPGGQMGLANK